jgi:hypothetical protein
MPHVLKCPRCQWSSRCRDVAHAYELIADHNTKCPSISSFV